MAESMCPPEDGKKDWSWLDAKMKEERELLTDFAKWCLGRVVTYDRGGRVYYWVDLEAGKGITLDELIDLYNSERE